MQRLLSLVCAGTGVLFALGCTPEFDWREVQPEGSPVKVTMPCKPSAHERRVELAGGNRLMRLHACTAGEQTWALAWVDVTDPAQVAATVGALRRASEANLGSSAVPVRPVTVTGSTPNALAGRSRVQGKRPDGGAVTADTLMFVHGLRVYQLSVIGPALPAAGVETFLGEVRIPR